MAEKSSFPLIRIGLIGPGMRLRMVVSGMLGSAPAGSIRVIAAYDPEPLSHASLRKELGYNFDQSSSEEDLARRPDIDWIFIGSWNCFHARQAIAALEAGKNVFCEKPLATSLGDCIAIRNAAQRSGRVFAFGLVLRYSPFYSKLRELLASGLLGKIVSLEFNETLHFGHGGYIFGDWRRLQENAGSHILEKCCHDINLVNWMVESVPIRVASFGGRDVFVPENAGRIEEIGPGKDGLPAYQGWLNPNAEHSNPFTSGADICDNQVAILEYANGVRATFHTNCHAAIPERRMYILGSRGALRADMISGRIEFAPIGYNSDVELVNTGVRGGHGGGDDFMARSLARTLLHGEPPLASVREGMCSAIAAFGINQAQSEGRVVDLRPMWHEAGIDPFTIMSTAPVAL